MTFRRATMEDLPQICEILAQAKEKLKSENIDQWQKGVPNAETFTAGIRANIVHVLEEDGLILGTITVLLGPDACYDKIDGAWLNEEPYAAFHRVCVRQEVRRKGIAGTMFAEAQTWASANGFHNYKIDTHPQNMSMQHALERNGFQKCGYISLIDPPETGQIRIAYQKSE